MAAASKVRRVMLAKINYLVGCVLTFARESDEKSAEEGEAKGEDSRERGACIGIPRVGFQCDAFWMPGVDKDWKAGTRAAIGQRDFNTRTLGGLHGVCDPATK